MNSASETICIWDKFVQTLRYKKSVYSNLKIYADIIILKQSTLCTTVNLGTPQLWPLLAGGRSSEVSLRSKHGKMGP